MLSIAPISTAALTATLIPFWPSSLVWSPPLLRPVTPLLQTSKLEIPKVSSPYWWGRYLLSIDPISTAALAPLFGARHYRTVLQTKLNFEKFQKCHHLIGELDTTTTILSIDPISTAALTATPIPFFCHHLHSIANATCRDDVRATLHTGAELICILISKNQLSYSCT